MEPYPIMDESGKVAEWLAAGRGVAVWPCLDLCSAALGSDSLTPADLDKPESERPRPGWRFAAPNTKPARVLEPEDVVFYRPVYSLKEWSDSPQGRRAAMAWCEAWNAAPENTERTAPVGRVLSRVILQGVQLESREAVDGPNGVKRPLVTRFRLAAVLWTAIVRTAPESDNIKRMRAYLDSTRDQHGEV